LRGEELDGETDMLYAQGDNDCAFQDMGRPKTTFKMLALVIGKTIDLKTEIGIMNPIKLSTVMLNWIGAGGGSRNSEVD
jgi:hypothetical protein